MGLNDSYSTVTSQILITEPLPAINKAYSLILQEEKRRQIGQTDLVIEPTALYANNFNPKGFQGHQGWNQRGTHGSQGAKGGNSKKERPVCTYYGIMGHVADKCYKLHGYPLGYKHKGRLLPIRFLAMEILAISFPIMVILGILLLHLCWGLLISLR